MKTFLIFVFILFTSFSTSFSQEIPNAGFENWSSPTTPDNWNTSNIGGEFTFINVTQSSEPYSGSSAVRLEVIDDGTGIGYFPTLFTPDNGFPISEAYQTLTGYYRFSPMAGSSDVLEIIVDVYSGTSVIGGSYWRTNVTAESYTQFSFQIDYVDTGTPTSAYISISVIDTTISGTGTIGSFAIIDDLSFGGPTDVDQGDQLPNEYALRQNYPNPFNPTTIISYELPKEGFVTLKVFDVLGNEVATLVNENKPAGSYNVNFDASNLASGIYLYKIDVNNFSKTRKLTLMK